MNTYRILKLKVGTTKKSTDTNCFTWFSRNVRHVCDGGLRCLTMYLATVAWDTSIPSLSNSACRRGAPQSTFAELISRIRFWISFDALGRPIRPRRLFQFQ